MCGNIPDFRESMFNNFDCSTENLHISLKEYIDRIKKNPYCPPLSEVKITDHSTGVIYTAEEVDRVLNDPLINS